MPFSVLEAMGTGLAVASTDVGDVRVMLAAENATLVTGRDEAALAAGLRPLLADAARRARLGAANRARAEAEFDEALMARRHAALWRGEALP
jgi:glycosyltransferase involved in cell wall biosynthesis